MKKQLRPRRKQGQTLILIAFAMVGLMALVALAVDGSNAFAQRRNAQNAVDGAAAAGTNLLLQYFMQPVGGGGNRRCTTEAAPCTEDNLTAAQDHQIYLAVQAALAAENGVDTQSRYDQDNPGTMDIRYIDQDGHTIDQPVGGNASVQLQGGQGAGSPGAAGVWVSSTSSAPTFFARILGINSVSADAHAASKIGHPESAVWPPQAPDGSGGLPTMIVWPITAIMTPTTWTAYTGNLDLYNFQTVDHPANLGMLNYSNVHPQDSQRGCTDASAYPQILCQILRGFNAKYSNSPFRGFQDVGEPLNSAPGPSLGDLSKMPLGSDGVNSDSRGVWVNADTENSLINDFSSARDHVINFHYTLLMPISDILDTSTGTPKYRVRNTATVRLIKGEYCSDGSDTSVCSAGIAPTNYVHIQAVFTTSEWNVSNGDFGINTSDAIQDGQFMLQQGQ